MEHTLRTGLAGERLPDLFRIDRDAPSALARVRDRLHPSPRNSEGKTPSARRQASEHRPSPAVPLVLGAEQKLGSVLRPLGPEIFASEDVAMARQRLRQAGVDHLVITDAAGSSVGFLTRADLEPLFRGPEDASSTPCADLIANAAPSLYPDDSFDSAVTVLRAHGIRPLLVRDEGALIGVLEPTTVFQWCAQHRPTVLDELASLASRRGPSGWSLDSPAQS